MRTAPVNQSGGPLLEGCEPLLLISMMDILVGKSNVPSKYYAGPSRRRQHDPAGFLPNAAIPSNTSS
jgi:hypothetical protein